MATKVHAPPRDVVLGICEAENTGDWGLYRTLLAEDVVIEHPLVGVLIGIDANTKLVRGFVESVRGYHRDVFDLVTDDETAAFRFSITGTRGDDESEASEVDVVGASFVRVREGRIVRVVEILTRTNLGLGAGAGAA